MVVVGRAQVGVRKRQLRLQRRVDEAVTRRFQIERATAGGFQSLVAVVFGQSQYAQAGAIGLLRMLTVAGQMLDDGVCAGADRGGPVFAGAAGPSR